MNERWQGIGWCDVTRSGYRIGINSKNEIIGFQDTLLTTAPEMLLYLRADNDDSDNIAIIGQGHSKGDCWLYLKNEWKNIGFCGGQNCVEIQGNIFGFTVYRQIAADRYVLHEFDGDGIELGQSISSMPWTSQGFLDVSGQGLALTDKARRIGDVMLPHSCGDFYLVGQDVNDPPKMVFADRNGKRLKVLAVGNCNEPRAAFVDGRIVACSRSGNDGALLALGTYDEFPDYISVVNPPIEPPKPPEVKPVSTPANIIEIMKSAGQTIDSRFPGLRERNNEEWMQKVAYLASKSDPAIGRKSRGGGARLSPDTMGYSPDGNTSNFYAVSIIRDNPDGGNEWRNPPLDYGFITGQLWIKAEPVDIGGTTPPPPPPPPPSNELEKRIAYIEGFLKAMFRSF